jgi:hypothetical protein
MGGGGDAPHYEAPPVPKVAPTPTPVQAADVEADKDLGTKKKKPRSAMANALSKDRGSILGSMLENSGRDKLG